MNNFSAIHTVADEIAFMAADKAASAQEAAQADKAADQAEWDAIFGGPWAATEDDGYSDWLEDQRMWQDEVRYAAEYGLTYSEYRTRLVATWDAGIYPVHGEECTFWGLTPVSAERAAEVAAITLHPAPYVAQQVVETDQERSQRLQAETMASILRQLGHNEEADDLEALVAAR